MNGLDEQMAAAAGAPVLPEGEYAIVELLGHRTLIGRISEVDRFGSKLLSIEPIFNDKLLPAILHHGSSIYALTPCSAERAFARQADSLYQLPQSLRDAVPPALLAPPQGDFGFGAHAPDFLADDEETARP